MAKLCGRAGRAQRTKNFPPQERESESHKKTALDVRELTIRNLLISLSSLPAIRRAALLKFFKSDSRLPHRYRSRAQLFPDSPSLPLLLPRRFYWSRSICLVNRRAITLSTLFKFPYRRARALYSKRERERWGEALKASRGERVAAIRLLSFREGQSPAKFVTAVLCVSVCAWARIEKCACVSMDFLEGALTAPRCTSCLKFLRGQKQLMVFRRKAAGCRRM